MKSTKILALACGLTLCLMFTAAKPAKAARQYYSSWSYYPSYGYYYRTYYYKPYASYSGYHYHYCIYYPSRPRYIYYYNPYRRVYWGRFDTQGKDGKHYSLLSEKDRKGKLSDIPESAFPEPGQMPVIPESEDGTRIAPPPKDLPDTSKTEK